MKNTKIKICFLLPFCLGGLPAKVFCADATAAAPAPVSNGWQKPAWLADLSVGAKEGYDDNVLLVSGKGLPTQSSWITTVSPKIGFNLAPLLGNSSTLQTLTLGYSADINNYHEAPSESYTQHKLNLSTKVKAGDLTFALDNAFVYDEGRREAATYALNQGAVGIQPSNQNDKYDNFFARAVPRERRNQIQDRAATLVQYDWNQFFLRPAASLIYYGLDTYFHSTSTAPYKGYQNCPDRYDANGGMDAGYKVTPDLAVTVGYRYGHQYQQALTPLAGLDTRESSSDYQRLLLGLEGKPWSWLKVKLAGGPDFRDYNSLAWVSDDHLTTYYGEAAVTATINPEQSVTFNYKQWQWVSANGVVPYFDSLYAVTYHYSATKQLGLDLGGKIQEADFTSGSDNTGSAPSQRDDRQYSVSAGATYAINAHLSASLTYAYDLGENVKGSLPAAMQSGYHDFEHQLVSLGLQYKF
jgi:hypothetical protein